MKQIALLISLFLGFQVLAYGKQKHSTYFFIRHAEKVISENPDPILHPDGEKRALKWAEVFKDIPLDAVYSTDYIRTLETAKPTAEDHNIELILYHPTKIDVRAFKKKTKGEKVLIVGHSNTIPDFVNKLIGKEKYGLIDENINGNLYIVDVIGRRASSQLLHLE